jgi:myo-inositol 2-dehydrogenase / D-chiro-inositol 1-dehydrogenase
VTVAAAGVRIGIVGAGGIGRVHAENLHAIDGVRVSAVMDASAERAEELGAAFGARAFTGLTPMLDEVDAVYVCSPPTFHREHVVVAVSAGKHVLCEKPLAATIEDGRAIAEAVVTAPVRVMVGFNNRFRPAFRRWRDLVHESIGSPLGAWIHRIAPSTPPPNANWRTTPGLLTGITIESAAHDIDLVRWALGEIEAVSASTASSLPELEGFDDTLFGLLRVEGGPAVTIGIGWSSAISMSSRGVVGSNGTACLIGPDMWTVSELRWGPTGGPERAEAIAAVEGKDLGYRAASRHFVECVMRDLEPEVTVRDGLAALEVSVALRTAAREGRTVRVGGSDRGP